MDHAGYFNVRRSCWVRDTLQRHGMRSNVCNLRCMLIPLMEKGKKKKIKSRQVRPSGIMGRRKGGWEGRAPIRMAVLLLVRLIEIKIKI